MDKNFIVCVRNNEQWEVITKHNYPKHFCSHNEFYAADRIAYMLSISDRIMCVMSNQNKDEFYGYYENGMKFVSTF